MIFDMTKRKGGATTPTNVAATIKNADDSGGSIGISSVRYDSRLGTIAPNGASSLAKGASSSLTVLDENGYITITANITLARVTYNGSAIAYQQVSGLYNNARPVKIELPSNYDDTIPIVIAR